MRSKDVLQNGKEEGEELQRRKRRLQTKVFKIFSPELVVKQELDGSNKARSCIPI